MLDTKYSADCVEYSPFDPELVIIGTYQNDEINRERHGSLILVNDEIELNRVETEGGVLDIKWSYSLLNNEKVFAAVTSLGNLNIYNTECQLLNSCYNNKNEVLNLSVDWSNRVYKDLNPSLVVSKSDGSVSSFLYETLQMTNSWNAHSYEAWVVAFDHYKTNTVYSGGDGKIDFN